MSDNGSCGGGSQPSEGSTASVKEDHSIITVDQSHENERLTTVVISNGNTQPRSAKCKQIFLFILISKNQIPILIARFWLTKSLYGFKNENFGEKNLRILTFFENLNN